MARKVRSGESAAKLFLNAGLIVKACILLAFVVAGASCEKTVPGEVNGPNPIENGKRESDGPALTSTSEYPDDAATRVIAYYFHNTVRCVSCLEIEKAAREAIEEKFGPELETGAVGWRVVNMELDENERFVAEYDLTVPSLVYSRIEGGRQVNWQKLDKVWDLLDDPGALWEYVQDELSKSLRTR